jgi:DNA replication protein DnaC
MTETVAKKTGDVMGRDILPEQEYTCEKHGAFKGYPVKMFNRTFEADCPECLRESQEENEREEKRRDEMTRKYAETAQKEEREKRLIEMNIGKKFWDESFETFNAYTPALKNYLDICNAFANDSQGRMLLMLGENGNGKNHLAVSILHKTGGCIYSVFEIELMLKECYSGKREEGESKLYRRLCDVPVLAINEIGKHKPGEWEMNFLSYIINKRYENLMPTILISNAHLQDNCPKKGCPDCLQSLLGNDILSRIAENGEIMIFNEEDYRYKKREMRGN